MSDVTSNPVAEPTATAPVETPPTPVIETPVTPVVPSVPTTPVGTQTPTPTGGLNDADLSSLGVPGLASSVALIRQQYPNLDLERAVGKAVENQDVSLLDVHYLREVAGANADILIAHLTDVTTHAFEHTQGVVQGIYNSVGGEAKWNAMATSFREKAPALILDAVRAKLDSPNIKDVQEAVEYVKQFAADNGLVNTPATRPNVNGAASEKHLTREEYIKEIRTLTKDRSLSKRERQSKEDELQKRRSLSIEAGY